MKGDGFYQDLIDFKHQNLYIIYILIHSFSLRWHHKQKGMVKIHKSSDMVDCVGLIILVYTYI